MRSFMMTFMATAALLLSGTAWAGGDVTVRAPDAPAIYAHLGDLPLAIGTGKSRDFAVKAVTVETGYAGYPYWLYVEATNLDTQSIRFGATNQPAGVVVEVFDAAGKPVPLTAEGRRTFGEKVKDWGHAKYTVPPRSVIGVSLNLARHFDLSRPGTYSLVVRVAPDYAGAEDVPARSKALVFTLLEPTRDIDKTSQGR